MVDTELFAVDSVTLTGLISFNVGHREMVIMLF